MPNSALPALCNASVIESIIMLAVFNNVTRRSARNKTLRFVATNASIQLPPPSGSQRQDAQEDRSGNSTQPGSSQDPPQAGPSSPPLVSAVPSSLPPPISEAQAHPFAGAKEYAENQEQAKTSSQPSNLPALPQRPPTDASHTPAYARPPFDTHRFFSELEKTFPTPTAHSLMRATRALLVDRVGRVRRDALTTKDIENQAYLFQAALSETRNEISLRQRNEAASIRSSLAALRREVDALDNRMKAEIDTLKHEIQMDVDNRKTESKTDLKQMDIEMEEVLNRAIIGIGNLRATTEEMKWENMRRSVLALGFFALAVVIIFEFNHRSPPKKAPQPPATKTNDVLDSLEQQYMST